MQMAHPTHFSWEQPWLFLEKQTHLFWTVERLHIFHKKNSKSTEADNTAVCFTLI